MWLLSLLQIAKMVILVVVVVVVVVADCEDGHHGIFYFQSKTQTSKARGTIKFTAFLSDSGGKKTLV